jgi:4-diphosphocytidyl-2C-methyl-D-erythritol kinase
MMETLRTVLSLPVYLTGSGSAMFIACENAEEAQTVVKQLPLPVRALAKFVESNPW